MYELSYSDQSWHVNNVNKLVLGQKYRSIKSSFLKIQGQYGPPPSVCKLFMKNVLDKNLPSERTWTDKWTPLHWAAHDGNFYMCELIISQMSWKNPGDQTGWTPLHSAAQNGHLRVVKLILSASYQYSEYDSMLYPLPYNIYGICPVFWDDMFGITPLKLATQYRHEEIRTAILEFVYSKVRNNKAFKDYTNQKKAFKDIYIQKILDIQKSVQEDSKDSNDKKDEDFNVLEEGEYYTTEDNDDINDSNDNYDNNDSDDNNDYEDSDDYADSDDYDDNNDNDDNEIQEENKDLEIQEEEEYSGVEEEKDKDLVFQEKEVDVIEGNDQAPAKRRRMTMTFRA